MSKIKKLGVFTAVIITIINLVVFGDVICEVILLHIYAHKIKKREKAAQKINHEKA